ncbi:MAG: hypothetical protein AB7O97_13585 [Planctomycetota bacterium]
MEPRICGGAGAGRLRRAPRSRALALALTATLALSGCLEVEQTVTIAPNGGGTIDVVLRMSEATLADVQRAAAANQGGAPADPGALFAEASVRRELESAGLELKAHAATRKDGARTVTLQAGFDAPATLRRSPLSGSAAEWEFTRGPVPGSIEVSFYPQGKAAWGEARQKAAAMGDTTDPVVEEFFERRRAQLRGLDVTVRLRLPGPVLRYTRNMEQTGDDEVTARVTEDRIRTPADLLRLLAPRYQVVFDAGACERFPLDP